MTPEEEAEKIIKKKQADGEINFLIQQCSAFKNKASAITKEEIQRILKEMQDDITTPEEAVSAAHSAYNGLE